MALARLLQSSCEIAKGAASQGSRPHDCLAWHLSRSYQGNPQEWTQAGSRNVGQCHLSWNLLESVAIGSHEFRMGTPCRILASNSGVLASGIFASAGCIEMLLWRMCCVDPHTRTRCCFLGFGSFADLVTHGCGSSGASHLASQWHLHCQKCRVGVYR